MREIIPVQQGEKWVWKDVGLLFNQEEGHSFWRKGDLIQGRGEINGVEVFISYCSRASGNSSFYGVNVFGETYSPISKDEVLCMLDNIRNHVNGDFIDADCY